MSNLRGFLQRICALLGYWLVFPTRWASRNLRSWKGLQERALRRSAQHLTMGDPTKQISSRTFCELWHFRKGVCFLNHGSFGAAPILVRNAQAKIRRDCEDEPMDFLARQVESKWIAARLTLANWLDTAAENIAFCENATAGMNEIAGWFPLNQGDEVLINDHEYGAVRRIWQRASQRHGAELVTVTLPMPLTRPSAICDAILSACTERTKLVVLSHITSPTAIRLPVEELCRQLRRRNIAVCIDGPHALLQETVRLSELGCDFYTASCHKWLCAPIGSGFVYVAPKWHSQVEPLRLSWGRLQPASPANWTEELLWSGTRDHSPYLAVPDALRFFGHFDLKKLDQRNHQLACYARKKLSSLAGAEPVTPEGREWFGWMVAVWLPTGEHRTLQQRLYSKYAIEVPIVHFGDRTLVRASCHLYVSTDDIDFLYAAIEKELRANPT